MDQVKVVMNRMVKTFNAFQLMNLVASAIFEGLWKELTVDVLMGSGFVLWNTQSTEMYCCRGT